MNAQSLGGRVFKAVVAPLILTSALIAIAPGAASASTCVSWTGVQPINPAASFNVFYGVAVLSPCNAWAVGYFHDNTAALGLIEHWNGTRWKQVLSPDPGGSFNDNVLKSVRAVSSTNAWAVGYYSNGTAIRTLILRWNGTAWKHVPSPDPGGSFNQLAGVAATSSRNAWTVGYYSNGTANQTLIEHWNGKAWKRVASPDPGGPRHDNQLFGVAATSSRNAWAVGFYRTAGSSHTLIEHWNGRAWKHVPSPNPSGAFNQLAGVAATPAGNAWAAGTYYKGSFRTLIEHWTGRAWKHVPSPNPSSADNELNGVTSTSPSNAWAAGFYSNGTAFQTLIEHWNGRAWKRVSSPDPGGSSKQHTLYGVAATSSTNMWAVGFYVNNLVTDTLALHCC